ncbi:MAG: RecQ family ATP-dependent DNA helicase [Prevotella sp.]|nr:RecQ family ATP-dependent DNA helicase [Prevotella sp.]
MDYKQILKEYWGYDDFRGIQREIIESIGSGHDTLGLMPTGGGKSLTFQVPALAQDGVCLVITPLIALMKDQVDHLRRQGVKAAAIYSGMTRQEIVTKLDNAILGGTKLLYIAPERLASEIFQIKVRRMNVSFITVDEAHCISQWGYDFRPSYLHIADIRRLKPDAPVLALTATATPEVADDIQDKLGFGERRVFRMSFERQNLAYVVRRTMGKENELVHILHSVAGSAIVYVRSRQRTADISKMLNEAGIKATHYHAGLEHDTKDRRQQQWHNDEVRVMVATNAFGMGIDKPDVRLVIHFDCPDSVEAYFQEAGRAGRDGKKAYAVLLFNSSDRRKLLKRVGDNYPEKEYIKKVYEDLAFFYQIGAGSGAGGVHAFDIEKFCRTFRHFPTHVEASLKILQRAGYLEYETEPDTAARLRFLLNRNELYQLDELSPNEDNIVTTLLRNYGGLFSDFVYIDESLVANRSGLSQEQVYLTLSSLSQRRIIHFIPQRKTPYITYLRDREETERIVISPEVYEQRKEQFERRIQSVISYAEDGDVCRSRQLLRYFGETRSDDCGICDVCIEHGSDQLAEDRLAPAKQRILDLLSDGKPHHITDLHQLQVPTRQLDAALEYLIHEEIITLDGSILSVP